MSIKEGKSTVVAIMHRIQCSAEEIFSCMINFLDALLALAWGSILFVGTESRNHRRPSSRFGALLRTSPRLMAANRHSGI